MSKEKPIALSIIATDETAFERACLASGTTAEDAAACVVKRSGGLVFINTSSPSAPSMIRTVNGNQAKEPKGLGDIVADGLSAIGITKERVSKIAGRDCGCKKRQEALNRLGKSVTDFLKGGTDADKLDNQES